MLSLAQIKIRVDAKTEARLEFAYKTLNDIVITEHIEKIFNPLNTKILRLNYRITNRNKLLDYFNLYLYKHLGIHELEGIDLHHVQPAQYESLTKIYTHEMIIGFVKDFMMLEINLRIDILDTIQAIKNDIIWIKEHLIIQFEEDKLNGLYYSSNPNPFKY